MRLERAGRVLPLLLALALPGAATAPSARVWPGSGPGPGSRLGDHVIAYSLP